jgi:hypothetical protein
VTTVLLLLLALLGVAEPAAAAAPRVKPAAVLSLSPASGPPGTATTATGSGFPARTRGTLTVSGASVAVTTDRQGRWSASVAVTGGPGPQAVLATIGGVSASADFDVVPPSRLAFGVSTPGGPRADAELDAVASLAGEEPTIVLSFTDMTRDLDVAGLHAVAARGATPLLTWEPWVAGQGRDQPAYSLDRIAAGDHDVRLRSWAVDLAAYGAPVMVRFAHEMNGDWYPWAEGVNGNDPGDFVAAWRHVHAVVTAAGAHNVEWVWAPNVPYWGSTALDGLFPGGDVVDVVALDGYNWGTSQTWSSWESPSQLFDGGLAEVRRLAPGLPVVVTETASAEQGGDKAQWVRALVAHLAAQPDVRAFVWFHHDKEADWRIDSSTSAATAFREALAARG